MVSCFTFRLPSILNLFLCMVLRKWFSFILLHVAVQLFQHHLLKRLSCFHWIFLPVSSNISWPYSYGSIFGFSTLLHWSMCFCASTILSWSLQLFNNLKSRIVMPPALLFFFKIALVFGGVLCGSMQILGLFVLALWKTLVVFSQRLHWMCRLF